MTHMNNVENDGAGNASGRQQGDWRSDLAHVAAAGEQEGKSADAWGTRGRDAVMRIPVSVRFVLGGARMPVAKLMSLTRGAIIPLDRKVGDLIDIVVNDQVVARGEIVALDEEATRFGISVREVAQQGSE
jgi:flagellar motor switch protein FliN/FliY